jgi:hypothetical protein
MAHLYEMTDRSAVGIDFLEATEQDWHLGGQATHIYWHWGVLHVEQGNHAKALALYDKTLQTAKRDDASGARSMNKCVNDLASLLFRLHLDGMDGEHTSRLAAEALGLAAVGEAAGRSSGSAAVNVHMTMLLALAGRQSEAVTELSSADVDPGRVSVRFTQAQELTAALCSAICAYSRHEYSDVVEVLSALQTVETDFWGESRGVGSGVVPDAWRPLGLSNAQRDVFTQLYLCSLISSRGVAAHAEAGRMLAARKTGGKDAQLTSRLLGRLEAAGSTRSRI